MTSMLAKYIGKKVFGETAKNHFGKDDPYFETVPADELSGRPSKNKRQSKKLPPGICEQDKKILTKARRRAYFLDCGINICGLQVGMSSLIGLVPGIGDVLDAYMAIMVIATCKQVRGGLPPDVLHRMYRNVILDFLVGLVPFLGDIADMVFRANTRNVALLEKYLREQGDRAAGMHDSVGAPPAYSETHNVAPNGASRGAGGPRQPEPVRVRTDRERNRGGWFGWGGQRQPETDLERGAARPSARVV
ncbi:MAG: hypothetical protein M1823_000931 [Watsoniomyces obsoletus]|nr:MAG: hypothetical protein M1823_000931 [Watsoniomyces obsoletus]